MTRWSRRAVMAVPIAAVLLPPGAQGQPAESFEAAEQAILAGRTPIASGIEVEIPQLSENGNSVDIAIRVESPATADDHVTAIYILSEKNPVARVARFTLTARAGRAEVATRIRLGTTQTVLVLAETSRGQVHRQGREVIVILGACVEGG